MLLLRLLQFLSNAEHNLLSGLDSSKRLVGGGLGGGDSSILCFGFIVVQLLLRHLTTAVRAARIHGADPTALTHSRTDGEAPPLGAIFALDPELGNGLGQLSRPLLCPPLVFLFVLIELLLWRIAVNASKEGAHHRASPIVGRQLSRVGHRHPPPLMARITAHPSHLHVRRLLLGALSVITMSAFLLRGALSVHAHNISLDFDLSLIDLDFDLDLFVELVISLGFDLQNLTVVLGGGHKSCHYSNHGVHFPVKFVTQKSL